MTAERAFVIVKEVAATEGPYAQEVAALSICVAAIESLPEFTRKRITNHLTEMFGGGAYSLEILVALAGELQTTKAALAERGV